MSEKPKPDVTAGRTDEKPRRAAIAPEPFLFAVLRAKDPTFEPSRHALGELTEVTVGRGAERSATRTERGRAGGALAIEHADPWMSGKHATITREQGKWVLRDVGSRNHTFVNGDRIEELTLEDGDVLEIGNVFFTFRAAVVSGEDDRDDCLASELAPPAESLATLSPSLARVWRRLATVAPSSLSVCVFGESGTGKDVAARAIHALSGRRGAFVAVNCAAIAPTLVESELFGYRKGAFSGATEDRVGLVRSADGGTLFLDEIGDLPLPAQGALLRVLQEREVVPVGATKPVPVDLRIVAATHRDLDELVAAKTFRADLQARLMGLTVKLPPLRDRLEDLGLLVRAVTAKSAEKRGPANLDLDAARAMFLHEWPLNVRELERRLSAAVVLAGGEPVRAEHVFLEDEGDADVPARARSAGEGGRTTSRAPTAPLGPEDLARKTELEELLRVHGGNVSAVARATGKARMQIQRWMRRYGLGR